MGVELRRAAAALIVTLTAAGACGGGSPSAPSSTVGAGDPASAGSAVAIAPGTSIQAIVDSHPGPVTFQLKAGIHHRQSITPRSGQSFIGEAGAVLDGDGVTAYAFETMGSAPRDVRIEGLEIRNYAPPGSFAAIQADNGANWVVTGNVIHDHSSVGLRMGPGARVVANRVYRNGVAGIIGYRSDGSVVDGNEIYENNSSGATGSGAGVRVVGSRDVVIRNNDVHDNNGKGIWSDTNFPSILVENNTVANNRQEGIWHEIGYDAVIRGNTVLRNGGPSGPDWLQYAGIAVTNSPNVQIYGNSVLDNANGIGVMYASGYASSGPYGAYTVTNLSVHDNVVRMAVGRTGLATNTGDASIYTGRNNRFEQNTYYLGSGRTYFLWREQNMSERDWSAAGNDVAGTFVR